jgi:hypothetical protein
MVRTARYVSEDDVGQVWSPHVEVRERRAMHCGLNSVHVRRRFAPIPM